MIINKPFSPREFITNPIQMTKGFRIKVTTEGNVLKPEGFIENWK